MAISLRNKKVLITAGPTWVKIDNVRVISNTATGSTGILLAEKLTRLDAKVTLLLGPIGVSNLNKKIKVLPFQYFDELKVLLEKELRSKKYDISIHSAAVSDYRPVLIHKGKISSGLKKLNISLRPTIKIINIFKKLQPRAFLVGFKFEPGAPKLKLIKEAKELGLKTKAEIVVANTLDKGRYLAYLVAGNKISGPIYSKNEAAKKIIKAIGILGK